MLERRLVAYGEQSLTVRPYREPVLSWSTCCKLAATSPSKLDLGTRTWKQSVVTGGCRLRVVVGWPADGHSAVYVQLGGFAKDHSTLQALDCLAERESGRIGEHRNYCPPTHKRTFTWQARSLSVVIYLAHVLSGR